MITLSDIIALAKQGYKKEDIKELIALGEHVSEAPAETENPAEGAPQDDVQNEPVNQEAQPELDYKQLYEAALKENETLQASLRTAQQANINKDVPAAASPTDVLTKFFE